MVRELAALQAVVSSAAKSVLGHSPSDIFHVGVVGELAIEFHNMEERWSRLEWPAAKIYDLLLGPPPSRAWLADRLDEATRQLKVELSARREVDAELEALWASAA
jgi:hypothetical protein